MKKLYIWMGILLALISPVLLQAENEPEPVDLGEVVVMASQPGVQISLEKTVIAMDQFQKPGQVATLTDVLTEIGGVDIQRATPLMAGPGDEVSIRGLNEGRMVIEIDGRRINHTGHMGRYIVDWSTLTLDDVDHIEIIRGGHSVLHPFAIGGVINIVTKKGRGKPTGSISSGYGRYNTWNLSAAAEGSATDDLHFHISGSRQESDGYLRNNFQTNESINTRLEMDLPRAGALTLGVKHARVEYGMPVVNDPNDPDPAVAALYDGSHPVFSRGSDQLRHLNWPQFPGGPVPMWEKETTYLDGIFRLPLGPGEIKLHGFMTDGERWTDLYNKAGVFQEDQYSDDRTQGLILEYGNMEAWEGHDITLGVEYQELGQPSGTRTIYRVKSAYVQDTWQVDDQWTITPGIRYYHVDKATYYSWMEMG
ncbi:MAG: TonB-dependent receptor, partial [Desulfobacterales bacterium]|nr:TonB-dependent receptor [Desulfobacterales bacterium]